MNHEPEDASPHGEGKKEIPKHEERLNPPYSVQTSPSDTKDSYSDDGPRSSPFVPGVVQLVLKQGLDGRRIAERLQSGDDYDHDDPNISKLRSILNQHRLDRIELSFDSPTPGVEKEANPPAGRERFLTIYFSTHENTRLISKKLRESNLVEEAVPAAILAPPSNPLADNFTVPGASGESRQWYLQRCRIDAGWQLKGPGQFFSGQGVVVADLDWGFRLSHDDLKDRVEHQYNIMSRTDYVGSGSLYYHGTAVLGLLGGAANGEGMAGVAFEAALWAIQADKGQPSGTAVPNFGYWRQAIDHVRSRPSNGRRKVICLEVQTLDQCNVESDPVIRQTVRDAIAAGIVVCVPAGNGDKNAGLNSLNEPFTATGSILVGATRYDTNVAVNAKLPRSNWGPSVVMAAPGDPTRDITCGTLSATSYRDFGLTSGATPKVAGTAALILEANPQLTHAEVRDILVATGTAVTTTAAKPLGRFLNAGAAIAEAQRRAVVLDVVVV
jgi:hypothetical protein